MSEDIEKPDQAKGDKEVLEKLMNGDGDNEEKNLKMKENGLEDGAVEKKEAKARGKWDSQLEFVLSCLSFAVGLGNIWRFPYLCYKNGGGAFLIPYFVSLFCMGLPIFLFEMGAGQFSSQGPIRVWKLCPLFEGIGYGMMMLSIYIGIYYNILISWTFSYFFESFTFELPWSRCDNDWNTEHCHYNDSLQAPKESTRPSEEFFHNRILGISEGIHDINHLNWELAGFLLLAWCIVYVALWKGVKSIGKFVYVTAIFPYVILLILLIRAATLPGFLSGVQFYIIPQWDKLADIQVWADACTQIFFSIGVTWGVVITLASYNDFNNNVYRDAMIVAIGNCMTSVFAGFVIFGIIGFMAHERGTPIDEVATQGPGLAFIAYPEAVAMMPVAPVWSVLFFLMLLLLGFGTQISTTETVVTILLDQFPRLRGANRKWITLVVCSLMFLVGLSMTSDAGIYIFTLFDSHAATYSALMIGAAEILVMSWIYGADNFMEDLRSMIGFYPPPTIFWKISWKFFSPLLLMGILLFTALSHSGNSYGDYQYPWWANTLGWLLTCSSVIMIPLVMTVKLWPTIISAAKQSCQPSPDWKAH